MSIVYISIFAVICYWITMAQIMLAKKVSDISLAPSICLLLSMGYLSLELLLEIFKWLK